MDKFLDISYCGYIEFLIGQLQKCHYHPEKYPSPEIYEKHKKNLEKEFSDVSLLQIIFNKNIKFKYKQKALMSMLGLYKLGKVIRNNKTKKMYGMGDFPELIQQELLNFYKNNPEELLDNEKKQIYEYLQKLKYLSDGFDLVFPYEFTNKYKKLQPPVFPDSKSGLLYVEHCGKRLFFPKTMNTKQITDYYNSLCLEQDEESPHCYTDASFDITEGDICLDIGCAEGNFSLTNIEKLKKLYLFEADPKWNEALNMTFEPWKSKVEIINKFVSDKDDAQNIALDTFVKDNDIDVTFIKIDAEGSEESILKGSRRLLKKNNLKIAACTYHRKDDDKLLVDVFSNAGFTCKYSKGYMIFIFDPKLSPPYLRRGLVRATKGLE